MGTVADPLYWMLLTVPATDPATVAVCGDPVYVTGEFVTDSVGVALAIVNDRSTSSAAL